MSSTIGVTKQALRLAKPGLARVRFLLRSPSHYTIQLNEQTHGSLGLSVANYPEDGLITINPVVGVRNQRLHKVLAELEDREFDPYYPSTISSPLGYLMPQRRFTEWNCKVGERERKTRKTMDDMVVAVEKHGIPYMVQHAGLEEMCRVMEAKPENWEYKYRLPVAYYLLGRNLEAERIVRQHLDLIASHTYEAAVDYRKFARNVLARLGQ